jgi:hypothetical protein
MTSSDRVTLSALVAHSVAPRLLDIHVDDCEDDACTGCDPQHLAQASNLTGGPLPVITGAELPPLAYAHSADHDPALTAPAHFRPIVHEGWVKPKSGTGLWTAPVTAADASGSPTDTAWLIYTREEMDVPAGSYSYLTEITPLADARVLRVDTHADLIAIVAAYPAAPITSGLHRGPYPNWTDMARDWDAVYLTDDGQWATRLPRSGPDLYSWDVATVLWLQPAYTVGRTVAIESVSVASEAGGSRG